MLKLPGNLWISATLLLALPLAQTRAQRLAPAAVTTVRHPLLRPNSGERDAATSKNNWHRILKGVAVGASIAGRTGLLLSSIRTALAAIACDSRNGVGSDIEPQRCNWHAYRRRAQYTWTGLALGGTIGGILGRLTPRSDKVSAP